MRNKILRSVNAKYQNFSFFLYKMNTGDLPLTYCCVFWCEFIDLVGFFSCYQGACNNDGYGYKNVTSKVNQHRFKLYRAYSKVVVLFFRPRQNVNSGTFTLQSGNDGKEMYKKSVMHVQSCCFANQTYWFFCRSRCRPRRRCLSSLLFDPCHCLHNAEHAEKQLIDYQGN